MDVAITNGVFNLCTDKPTVLQEVCRVLKSAGRLQMADIFCTKTSRPIKWLTKALGPTELPALWRLHMVHHADLDFDVTTGLRFHTIEIVLSFGIKCAAIVVLGASPLAVLIFEVLLNGTAMFNHSNVQIPFGLDRLLRLVVVTLDMHRVPPLRNQTRN